METHIASEEDILMSISFLGTALGPFFLFDPVLDAAAIEPALCAVASLRIEEAVEEWPFADTAAAACALGMMQRGLRNEPSDGPHNPERHASQPGSLALEFRRLFVGPGPKAAPPWGSVYTDEDCVVFGRSCLDLRKWLAQNGIAVGGSCNSPHVARGAASVQGEGSDEASQNAGCPPSTRNREGSDEPEDHIGTMLLLMAWLSEHRPGLLYEYLSQHLLTWAPHFLRLMDKEATQPFYQGLAQLTLASLRGIANQLGLEVHTPRFYR